jgi:transketolase
MALYAALAERGFFPEETLSEYARNGGRLAEHPGPRCVAGIDAATGSLGHGLPIGAGLALAAKRQGSDSRIFVLLSDAECFEGSVWEAALFAAAQKLDNLVAIVDDNNWSAMVRTRPQLEPLGAKWEAFGWGVREVDGHDIEALVQHLRVIPRAAERPTVILARTIKGKGVSFMEDVLEWHYRPPSPHDLAQALRELGG